MTTWQPYMSLSRLSPEHAHAQRSMLAQTYWAASCTGPSAKTVLNSNDKAPAVSVLLAQLDPSNATQYETQAASSFTPFLEQYTTHTTWVTPDPVAAL